VGPHVARQVDAGRGRQRVAPAPPTPTLYGCRPVRHDHMPLGNWAAQQATYAARCRAQLGATAGQAESWAGQAWDRLWRGQLPPDPRTIVRTPSARSTIECACATLSPENVMRGTWYGRMARLPLARRHLDHYLGGHGADLNIDVLTVIFRDSGVRRKLRASIARGGMRGVTRLEQSDYAVEDFQFAFGAIDCVGWRAAGTLAGGSIVPLKRNWRTHPATVMEVSFLDRYEFHPEAPRVTQCVHAAAVEMKLQGAADYWQRGSAYVPLTYILR
jgi:hypothetical protein